MLLLLALDASVSRAQINAARDAAQFSLVFDYSGHYVNDHCLIYADSLWHLYFIDGVISDAKWSRRGNEVAIGHATSSDLRIWTLHPPALTVAPYGALDGAHVYAPHVIRKDSLYYMAYTGNERTFESGEHMFLATSRDLHSWRRVSDTPFIVPDSAWASYVKDGKDGGRGGPHSGRDPHLHYDSLHGYIAYYVARVKSNAVLELGPGERSCIAAARSPDMSTWTDEGPILFRKTVDPTKRFSWTHPESPCLVQRNGMYYLFWKSGEGTHYTFSRDPLEFPDTKEYFLATTHASEIFEWNGEWYITSCSRDVDDVAHIRSDRRRGLYMARLIWNGDHPTLAPLDTPRALTGIRRSGGSLVFPNPVVRGAIVQIGVTSESTHATVDVFDALGRLISSTTTTPTMRSGMNIIEIPTYDIHPGLYRIRVGDTILPMTIVD